MIKMQLPWATILTVPYYLYLKLNLLKLVAVTIIKVIPYGFIKLKASIIFAGFGSAVEAVLNKSITI